ncbi:hypothetical protein [Paracoccus jiaweipingae]
MTNGIALTLALMVLAVFAVDAIWLGGGLPVFMGRKLLALIEWVEFWR